MPAAEELIPRARDVALAEAAAREAGTLARAYFHAAPAAWNKADRSPVSEADHAVDRLLRARLTAFRPGYGWLSEESGAGCDHLDRRRVWIVDPIDGTRSFLRGRSDWVVSVALVEAGRPVIGIVYNPLREEMITAVAGEGATLNGEPIAVAARDRIAGIRMLANPAPIGASGWREPWPEMDIERYNSLAYRVVSVASGRFDAAIALGRIHEWDIAAADLVIAEAGGSVTDLAGQAFTYNRRLPTFDGAIAANPALHAALVAFIARNAPPDVGRSRRRA